MPCEPARACAVLELQRRGEHAVHAEVLRQGLHDDVERGGGEHHAPPVGAEAAHQLDGLGEQVALERVVEALAGDLLQGRARQAPQVGEARLVRAQTEDPQPVGEGVPRQDDEQAAREGRCRRMASGHEPAARTTGASGCDPRRRNRSRPCSGVFQPEAEREAGMSSAQRVARAGACSCRRGSLPGCGSPRRVSRGRREVPRQRPSGEAN